MPTPAVVQSVGIGVLGGSGFNPGQTVSLAFPSPNTAGNCIVAIVGTLGYYGTEQVRTTLKDTNGNTYQLIGRGPQEDPSYFEAGLLIYIAENIAAGPNTFEITNTDFLNGTTTFVDPQAADLDVVLHEITGVPTSLVDGGFVAVRYDNIVNHQTIAAGPFNVTVPSTLLISFVYDFYTNTSTFVPSSGWNVTQQTLNPDGATLQTATQLASSTGSYTNSWVENFAAGTGSAFTDYAAYCGIVAILPIAGVQPVLATPLQMEFDAVTGTNPANQTITLSGGTDSWTASAVSINNPYTNPVQPGTWLSVTSSGSSPGTLTVSVNTTGLDPAVQVNPYSRGSYYGLITIVLATAPDSPIYVNVTLILGNSFLILSNNALTFNAFVGGNNPPAQSIVATETPNLSSFIGANKDDSSSASAWLTSITQNQTTSPSTITFAVNITGLTVGTYVQTVFVYGASNGNLAVTLTLVISPLSGGSGILSSSPNSLSFTAAGANPANQTLTASSTLSGTPTIAATSGQAWLIINGSSSVTGVSPLVLTVSVDATLLTVGTYTGYIELIDTNPSDGTHSQNSPLFITVTLVVQLVSTILPTNAHWKTSRYPAMTRVLYPLVPPPPPSYKVNGNDYTFALPPDNRDVFGILIQGRRTQIYNAGGFGILLISDVPDNRQFKIVGQDIKGNYLEEIVKMSAGSGFTSVRSTKPFAYILWVDVYFGTILNEVPTPLPDGVTTVFTVDKQIVPGSETVYLNGNPLVPSTPTVLGDYTVSGNSITLTSGLPLEAGFQLLVSYIYEYTTNSTVQIQYVPFENPFAGEATGILEPNALQWLANPILYRYEDVTLSMPAPIPGTALSLGSPIVGPVVNDPGLTYTFAGACYPAVGPYVGRDDPDPAEMIGADTSIYNNVSPPNSSSSIATYGALFGVEFHGYICPDKLYVYYYNLLDEMSLPFIVELHSPTGTVLNVRTDYGAVGDGVADDTAAVQCALDQAHKNWVAAQAAIGSPLIGSPVQGGIGTTVVLIPSGCNCLVGHAPIIQDENVGNILQMDVEGAPYSYTMQKSPLSLQSNYFVGDLGMCWNPVIPSNIGAFALRIQSGVTLQVEGQLTQARPPQRLTAWARYLSWSRRLLVGVNVHDVIIKGNGIIDMNGVPFLDFNGADGLGGIALYGYNLRIEDVTIKNTSWDTNLAKTGQYFEFINTSTGLPMTERTYTLYEAANAIGIELYMENKATVIKNVTIDGSGIGPTRFQAWNSATIFYEGDSFHGISGTGVGDIQNWGFAGAIVLVSDATAVMPNPVRSSRNDGSGIIEYEFWTSEDVFLPTGVTIDKNKIIRCLIGVVGEADNYTIQNNDLTACWVGIYVVGGKKVTVKGNIITWDDTPILDPNAIDPYTPNLPIIGTTNYPYYPITFLGNPLYPSIRGFGYYTSVNGPRPFGIAITVDSCTTHIYNNTIPGELNSLGVYSGRLMGCRVYDNQVSKLAIGTGIASYFVQGNPDVAGVMWRSGSGGSLYTSPQYMSDIEIFGNSCNNNWKGFTLVPAGGPSLPWQRINLHDNQARQNIAYRGIVLQPPITTAQNVIRPGYAGGGPFIGYVGPTDGWAVRDADFPAWESTQFGMDLRWYWGEFDATTKARGLSWCNVAIRNEMVVDGIPYRHWYFSDNEYPLGILDNVNTEFTVGSPPEVNYPYGRVIQQMTETQERNVDANFDYMALAVQQAPPNGAVPNSYDAFPQPQRMKVLAQVPTSWHFGDNFNEALTAYFWAVFKNHIHWYNGMQFPTVENISLVNPTPHDNQPVDPSTPGVNLVFRVNYRYILDQSSGYVAGGLGIFAGLQEGYSPSNDPPPPVPPGSDQDE